MRLYFLRHGVADWPKWDKPDEERPLTKAGRKEVHEVGGFLAGLKVRPDVILTSPLPRAVQTADFAAEHLKVRVREEKLLAKGFAVEDLRRLLRKYPQQDLMLVGHEPDFTSVIAADRQQGAALEGWPRTLGFEPRQAKAALAYSSRNHEAIAARHGTKASAEPQMRGL